MRSLRSAVVASLRNRGRALPARHLTAASEARPREVDLHRYAQPRTLVTKRVPVPGDSDKLAFTCDGFLSTYEAERLIAFSERRGFEPALVNIGAGRQAYVPESRRCSRSLIDSEFMAAAMWRRLRPLLPRAFTCPRERDGRGGDDERSARFDDDSASFDDGMRFGGRRWRAVGLNERLRFFKYEPGDYFRPHSDGRYVDGSGDGIYAADAPTSFLTMMVYLNAPERGGDTRFLRTPSAPRRGENGRDRADAADDDGGVAVTPAAGSALVFDHRLRHEGCLLEAGVKYAIRTDVMFERC